MQLNAINLFWISNFRRVLNVVYFFCTWPAPTLSPTSLMARLFSSQIPSPVTHQHPSNLAHSTHAYLPVNMEQSVPKRRHINFRRRGITQKKAYNYQFMFTDYFIKDMCVREHWNSPRGTPVVTCNTDSILTVSRGSQAMYCPLPKGSQLTCTAWVQFGEKVQCFQEHKSVSLHDLLIPVAIC
jgi:hypothetical protein